MSKLSSLESVKDILTFPLRGEHSLERFAIACALVAASFIVPILPLIFVLGYLLRILRQAIAGETLSLPAWDDWGQLLTDGLRMAVINLVYLLPGILVTFCGFGIYMLCSFSLPFTESAAMHGSHTEAIFPIIFLAGMVILFLSMFVGSFLMIAGGVPLPMAVCHFAAHDDVSAAFRVSEWWKLIKANPGCYFVAWVNTAGLMAIMYVVVMMAYWTIILCCLVPVLGALAGFYASAVSAALFGEAYREAQAKASSSGKKAK